MRAWSFIARCVKAARNIEVWASSRLATLARMSLSGSWLCGSRWEPLKGKWLRSSTLKIVHLRLRLSRNGLKLMIWCDTFDATHFCWRFIVLMPHIFLFPTLSVNLSCNRVAQNGIAPTPCRGNSWSVLIQCAVNKKTKIKRTCKQHVGCALGNYF